MKTKKITRKLELKKETIFNLNHSLMKGVKGGWIDPPKETESCKSVCKACIS
jgi:hypothetical protein